MTALAIATGPAILAFIGLVLGVVVLGLVVALFVRVVRPLFEIRRYALDIQPAIDDIARNLEGIEELERTRELAANVPRAGGAYVEQLARGPR
jgi:hypothetical protein